MTDEVAALVLRDGFKDNIALSLSVHQLHDYIDLYRRFMDYHSSEGKIDLELEFLPDRATLDKRKTTGKSLTRPELAILFAYSKNIMKQKILQSSFMQDEAIVAFLAKGFPKRFINVIQTKYGPLLIE